MSGADCFRPEYHDCRDYRRAWMSIPNNGNISIGQLINLGWERAPLHRSTGRIGQSQEGDIPSAGFLPVGALLGVLFFMHSTNSPTLRNLGSNTAISQRQQRQLLTYLRNPIE